VSVSICLDAGHGSRDPGAMARDLTEKELNLELARLLRDRLEAEGIRVLMTRSEHRTATLAERVRAVAGTRALLSLDHNASGNAGAPGRRSLPERKPLVPRGQPGPGRKPLP